MCGDVGGRTAFNDPAGRGGVALDRDNWVGVFVQVGYNMTGVWFGV